MDEIIFLTLEQVIEIQADQIARYGGSHGTRDAALLQSAVAMPQATFGNQYLHGDLFEMAAAYLFHIVQNHPFVDGNKRVGAMAAFTFMRINGYLLNADDISFENLVLDAARGKTTKEAVADFFRKHVAG